MDIPESTGEIRDDKGRFVPGVSGNPAGRPQGSVSIIGRIKKVFEEQPEFFETYVAEVLADPKLRGEIIRQIDGAPSQKVDITTKGESIKNPLRELSDAELAALAYGSEERTG